MHDLSAARLLSFQLPPYETCCLSDAPVDDEESIELAVSISFCSSLIDFLLAMTLDCFSLVGLLFCMRYTGLASLVCCCGLWSLAWRAWCLYTTTPFSMFRDVVLLHSLISMWRIGPVTGDLCCHIVIQSAFLWYQSEDTVTLDTSGEYSVNEEEDFSIKSTIGIPYSSNPSYHRYPVRIFYHELDHVCMIVTETATSW